MYEMIKKRCGLIIAVIAFIAVLLTAVSAFSVSYARWTEPTDSNAAYSLAIGEWNKKAMTDAEILDALGGNDGIITENGQKIFFGEDGKCNITLAPGEKFNLVINGKVVKTSWGTLLGITLQKPDDVALNGNTFTPTEGGDYTIENKGSIFGITFVGIAKQ